MSPKSKIVCECLQVTEAQFLKTLAASGPVETLKELAHHTEAGTGCTACHPLLREYLARQGRSCGSATSSPRRPSAERDSSRALSP